MSILTAITSTYNPATHKVVPKDAVVLDLTGVHADGIVQALRDRHAKAMGTIPGSTGWSNIAEQIAAQVTPPRTPEPGWGAIVEARTRFNDERLHWQRTSHHTETRWECQDTSEYTRKWSDLVEPVLVRDAMEKAS